jgi:hypothetical protein
MLNTTSSRRWKPTVAIALLTLAGSLGLVQLCAADPQKSDAAKTADEQKPASTDPAVKPEFLVQVVDLNGNPVVGAKVTPDWYSYQNARNLSGSIEPDDAAPAITDANGLAHIVFEMDERHLHKKTLSNLLKFGFKTLYVIVEHPDHPIRTGSIDPLRPSPIQLADSDTIEIRGHRTGQTAALQHLYPLLGVNKRVQGSPPDWSQAADGLLTIHGVDVTSLQPTRWLRIVHIPDAGPAWFSDLIDLVAQKRNPISIDAVLKPGVRVEGRLDDSVPRPVKNGHVVGKLADGRIAPENDLRLEFAAEVAADGTFVFESIPANEPLQLVAVCDGWVSRSPTDDQIVEHCKQWIQGGLFADPRRFGQRFICAQIILPAEQADKPTILMQPAAACEVTVQDDQGQPIPGASVSFTANYFFYGPGNSSVGGGADSLTFIRDALKTGKHQDIYKLGVAQLKENRAKYSATTDASGIAVVSTLPAGRTDADPVGRDLTFFVSRDGYQVSANPPLADYPPESQPSTVHLKPGQTSRITVHMHKMVEK